MRNSPSVLRRRAEAYRSISLGISTAEVRAKLLEIADQLDHRADAWVKMNGRERENA